VLNNTPKKRGDPNENPSSSALYGLTSQWDVLIR
jgi:hypothetical protein